MPHESPTPPLEDRQRVEHMLRSANDARTIVRESDVSALEKDMIRVRALVNCFTEIGEAAARLTATGRSCVGEIPWREIIGMRNIVVHVYWGIDISELVKTTRDDLPQLIQMLKGALTNWPQTRGAEPA